MRRSEIEIVLDRQRAPTCLRNGYICLLIITTLPSHGHSSSSPLHPAPQTAPRGPSTVPVPAVVDTESTSDYTSHAASRCILGSGRRVSYWYSPSSAWLWSFLYVSGVSADAQVSSPEVTRSDFSHRIRSHSLVLIKTYLLLLYILQLGQPRLLHLLCIGVHLPERLDGVKALAQTMHGVDQRYNLGSLKQVRVPLGTARNFSRVSYNRISVNEAATRSTYSKALSSSSKRIFNAVPIPEICSFPHSLHLSHPVQSRILETFLKLCLN